MPGKSSKTVIVSCRIKLETYKAIQDRLNKMKVLPPSMGEYLREIIEHEIDRKR